MLPTVFWILEGYRKLYEVRPTSPTLGLHPFADMSGNFYHFGPSAEIGVIMLIYLDHALTALRRAARTSRRCSEVIDAMEAPTP